MSRIKSKKTLQCVEERTHEVHFYQALIQTPNEHSNAIQVRKVKAAYLNYS